MRRYLPICGLAGVGLLLVGLILFVLAPSFNLKVAIPIIGGLVLLTVFFSLGFSMVNRFWSQRSTQHGANAVLVVVIVLAIVVLANFVGTRHHFVFDTTKVKIYSLSDQTVKVLKSLHQEVKVIAFYRQGRGQRVKDLLESYRARSRKLSFEFVDPDRSPEQARRYNTKEYETVVVECGTYEERFAGEATEKKLTSAILKVSKAEKKVVYFLEGHAEKDLDDTGREGFSAVRDELKNDNYAPKSLLLAEEEEVPEDCSLLVAAGPQKEYLVKELSLIRDYLDKGGKALFLLDPGVYSGLEGIAAPWSIVVGDDFVVDASGIGSFIGVSYAMPIVSAYGKHPITKDLRAMSFYPLARSVSLSEQSRGELQGTEVAKTSSQSWGETDLSSLKTGAKAPRFDPKTDKRGPVSLAVAVSGKSQTSSSTEEKTRLVVFGDSDFADNQFFKQQANGDLFLNCINWLTEEEELISIRPKNPEFNPLQLTKKQAKSIFWLVLIIYPAAVLITGVTIWWRRKR
jgi:ABC-type uncharacterized transport system involved in gliding motility auxiliary subunit